MQTSTVCERIVLRARLQALYLKQSQNSNHNNRTKPNKMHRFIKALEDLQNILEQIG